MHARIAKVFASMLGLAVPAVIITLLLKRSGTVAFRQAMTEKEPLWLY